MIFPLPRNTKSKHHSKLCQVWMIIPNFVLRHFPSWSCFVRCFSPPRPFYVQDWRCESWNSGHLCWPYIDGSRAKEVCPQLHNFFNLFCSFLTPPSLSMYSFADGIRAIHGQDIPPFLLRGLLKWMKSLITLRSYWRNREFWMLDCHWNAISIGSVVYVCWSILFFFAPRTLLFL